MERNQTRQGAPSSGSSLSEGLEERLQDLTLREEGDQSKKDSKADVAILAEPPSPSTSTTTSTFDRSSLLALILKKKIKPKFDVCAPMPEILARIEKLSHIELIEELNKLSLDSNGQKKAMMRRLQQAAKGLRHEYIRTSPESLPVPESPKQKSSKSKLPKNSPHRYICVLDFEATCEYNNLEYPHEIIEFPIVVVDTARLEIVGEFQSYCRPIFNPVLSPFCTSLTGITQDTVDKAPTFPEVLTQAFRWLRAKKFWGPRIHSIFATDGPWDFAKFMSLQCALLGMERPEFAQRWINVRRSFSDAYGVKGGVNFMLDHFGLKFQGREHSGIDDTKNIARIMIELMKDEQRLWVEKFRLSDQDKLHSFRSFALSRIPHLPPDLRSLVLSLEPEKGEEEGLEGDDLDNESEHEVASDASEEKDD